MKLLLCALSLVASVLGLEVGTGIYDVTGPTVAVGLMGMATPNQTGAGLHFRLRSRAFIFAEKETSVVYVSVDVAMIFQEVKDEVIRLLNDHFGSRNSYFHDNVLLSATHTHSGPSGFSYHILYDFGGGYSPNSFNAIANGIAQSIIRADANLGKGSVSMATGSLAGANLNRSPYAYLFDPADERARYDNNNTDHDVTTIRIKQGDRDVGMVNWFAVHGTSMSNWNQLISGDNKGYASLRFEEHMNGPTARPGAGPFVAAFGQSNEGDISPNTEGPKCLTDNQPCRFNSSTCWDPKKKAWVSQLCRAHGPGGYDDFLSAKIIGERQYEKALDLFQTATEVLTEEVAFAHTYVNMEDVTVSPKFSSTGKTEETCKACLGDAFAAGTIDGPGEFDFKQGTTSPNKLWNAIASIIGAPSKETAACQEPKSVLLAVGDYTFPSPWVVGNVPIQLLKVGRLYLVGVPGEFTTMSGRRLRETVSKALIAAGVKKPHVVIAGLANSYTHYITTYEEFQAQRYEGGSTLYGPHTLAAYQQEFTKLATLLAKGKPVPTGPSPDIKLSPVITDISALMTPSAHGVKFQPFDAYPKHVSRFGDVKDDVGASYTPGSVVSVSFYGGHPNRNLQTQTGSYLTVDKENPDNSWTPVLLDSHWDTKMKWAKGSELVWPIAPLSGQENIITVEWAIAADTPPGTYRITHTGSVYYMKDLKEEFHEYTGVSSSFTVGASASIGVQ